MHALNYILLTKMVKFIFVKKKMELLQRLCLCMHELKELFIVNVSQFDTNYMHPFTFMIYYF